MQRGGGGGKLCVKIPEFVGETTNSEAFMWLMSICTSRWWVLRTIPEGELGAEKKGGGKGCCSRPNIVGFRCLGGCESTIPQNSISVLVGCISYFKQSSLFRPEHREDLSQSGQEENLLPFFKDSKK